MLKAKYLEKQSNDAQGQLRDIVRLFTMPVPGAIPHPDLFS
jgi:hypothetical protein